MSRYFKQHVVCLNMRYPQNLLLNHHLHNLHNLHTTTNSILGGDLYIYIYMCKCIYLSVHIYICKCMWIDTHIYIYTYLSIYCFKVHIYIYIYIDLSIYLSIYVYTCADFQTNPIRDPPSHLFSSKLAGCARRAARLCRLRLRPESAAKATELAPSCRNRVLKQDIPGLSIGSSCKIYILWSYGWDMFGYWWILTIGICFFSWLGYFTILWLWSI